MGDAATIPRIFSCFEGAARTLSVRIHRRTRPRLVALRKPAGDAATDPGVGPSELLGAYAKT